MKKFLIAVLTIVVVIFSLFLLIRFVQYFKQASLELSQVYTDSSYQFSFNYPKGANVYKRYDQLSKWLRVFIDGDTGGPSCDLFINPTPNYAPPKINSVVKYNELTWQKWKYNIGSGMYDAQIVGWWTSTANNTYRWDTGVLEDEKICERIVSTFKVLQ